MKRRVIPLTARPAVRSNSVRSRLRTSLALRVAVVSLLAGHAAAADTLAPALRAVDDSAVAIFAFRDRHDRPMAWPVTPYRDGNVVAVTSTLAYMKKTLHVRRDGRVALLAGGWLLTGHARVHADVSGDEFVSRFLPQELRKYPPARDIVRVPFHRYLFWWYFGRVCMEFTPDTAREVTGVDRATLITLDANGFPRITPVRETDLRNNRFALQPPGSEALVDLPDGPATVLVHMEPSMSDLRQLVLRGQIQSGVFVVKSRHGSLEPPAPRGWLGEIRRHIEFHRHAREAARVIQGWER